MMWQREGSVMRRREVITRAAFAAWLGLPAKGATESPQPLPEHTLFERDPEAYWARIRKEQFFLPEWRAFLNTGTLGVAPKPVVKAMIDSAVEAAALTTDNLPRWGGETLEEMRQEFADFFGCRREELALTNNTTQGMNTIANGLDLRPGDEVLITDQEHPGGTCCWLLKQARFGSTVREVAIPIPPRSPEQITDRILSAISPRTRVLSFSGITTKTGLLLPVRQICEAARAKGVITVVDGAHMNGQVSVNFRDLGCDYFAGSPHKWMLTPPGCGVLYGRQEMLDRLWVLVARRGWDDKQLHGARFMMLGTNNLAVFHGYLAALRLVKQIGPERIYARIHQLARRVYQRARELPNVEMLTPDDGRMFGGMVTFRIKGADLGPLVELCKKRRIWVALSDRIRISTHIHTRPPDLDAFFNTLEEALRPQSKRA